jgi:nucleoside-diphosphate-sugar epimerase
MLLTDQILVIGSSGQIGTELVARLREINGSSRVIAADLRPAITNEEGPYIQLDVLNREQLASLFSKHSISQVYLLAAMLSATGEKHPLKAWDLNMNGLFNLLEAQREGHFKQLFWPSSIAVFGPSTPKSNTPQLTITEPTTVYGISKLAGERWCEYYFQKYGVDVRSVRYPGLIGYKSAPGGGTTDYAVHIFHEALEKQSYTCFLNSGTRLPMMYMPDGIDATVKIMNATSDHIKIRSSYNLAGTSFTPAEIALEIKRHIPEFKIDYMPDFRQEIASSWPESIDDSQAREDWGWKNKFDLTSITNDMLIHLRERKRLGILA